MRIHDISVRHFRGIESLTRLPVHDMNTFVGENDAGKSSVIYALDAFFNGRFEADDLCHKCPVDECCEVTVRFKPPTDTPISCLDRDGLLCITKKFPFVQGKVKPVEYYTCLDPSKDATNCWGAKEATLNKYLEDNGIEYSRSGAGITNLSKINALWDNLPSTGRVQNIHLFKDASKNLIHQYPYLEMPSFTIFDADASLDESATSFQGAFKSIATEAFARHDDKTAELESIVADDLKEEFSEIASLMQKNAPGLESIDPRVIFRWDTIAKFNLSLKFFSDDRPVPLSKKGTGFRRLLMVAYFEYASTKDSKNHIYAIEEPETYLHPQLQHQLLASIKELSMDNQFFITTHSAVFAGASDFNSITVVTQPDGVTSCYNQYDNEDQIFEHVISTLGIRPNASLYASNYKHVLFVEGPGDVGFYQTYAKTHNMTWFDDVLIIPCGGSQIKFFAEKNLCQKIVDKYTIAIDSDKGSPQYDTQVKLQQALRSVADRDGCICFVLNRRAIENYYHIDAVNRVLALKGQSNISLSIGVDTNVPKELEALL